MRLSKTITERIVAKSCRLFTSSANYATELTSLRFGPLPTRVTEIEVMEKLVSSWFNVRPVPEDYIFPPETRAGNLHVPVPIGKGVPVIDLSEAEEGDRARTVQKILKAAQEFGLFQVHASFFIVFGLSLSWSKNKIYNALSAESIKQVINHGVSENIMNEAMSVFKEVFQIPAEAKQKLYSEDVSKRCRIFTSSVNYTTEKVHLWRDCLRHPCHPLEQWQHIWPQTPTRYRECVGACSVEVKKFSCRILRLVSEGLGLKSGYFDEELSGSMMLSVSVYPPCPEPSLTLGITKHADPNLITIILQDDINGLQVFKDDTWIGVEPIPHAFVVIIGCQMQVMSNNKLKTGQHRAVINGINTRTTGAFFVSASDESIIEPAKDLTDQLHPPVYKSFKIKDFLPRFLAENGDPEAALKFFLA